MLIYIKRNILCKYNPSRQFNVRCIKSKNIWLHFIASSFRTSMSYFSRLRVIAYCLNNSSLIALLMHGTPISNGFIFFRWRSYTFVLLNFNKPVWILNMCKLQNLLFSFRTLNENSLLAVTEQYWTTRRLFRSYHLLLCDC